MWYSLTKRQSLQTNIERMNRMQAPFVARSDFLPLQRMLSLKEMIVYRFVEVMVHAKIKLANSDWNEWICLFFASAFTWRMHANSWWNFPQENNIQELAKQLESATKQNKL